MVGTFPQGWEETALITIERFAATPIVLQANALTETVDISEPDYPGEGIPTISGGRIWKQSPQEDGEVTLELYPVRLDIDTTPSPDIYGGLFQFFASNQTIDDTSPTQPMATNTTFVAGTDYTRDRFRVSIMWTDDTAVTSAAGTTATPDKVALRFTAMGCRIISHKSAFTDGVLKVTATFKFPAMNKSGEVKMYKWQSTNDGEGAQELTALPSYVDDSSWS